MVLEDVWDFFGELLGWSPNFVAIAAGLVVLVMVIVFLGLLAVAGLEVPGQVFVFVMLGMATINVFVFRWPLGTLWLVGGLTVATFMLSARNNG